MTIIGIKTLLIEYILDSKMSLTYFKLNSTSFNIEFFKAFIKDWNEKLDVLKEEFARTKSVLDAVDFKNNCWPRTWVLNRPNVSLADITNAIMFMALAGPYIECRQEQVQMKLDQCNDPIQWANLSQRLQKTYQEVDTVAPDDVQKLLIALNERSFLKIFEGEGKNFQVLR